MNGSQAGESVSTSGEAGRFAVSGTVPRRRWLVPLLLLFVILGESALALRQDRFRLSFPPTTWHNGFVPVVRLARVMEGWSPVDPFVGKSEPDPTCSAWNCISGFDQPPDPARDGYWRDRTRWLWEHGYRYQNRYPLYGAPAAVVISLFPGHVQLVALGPRLWMAALLVLVYLLGKRVHGPGTGLLGAVIVAGTPGIFGLGMNHVDSVPIAALAVALSYAILASDGWVKLGWCFLAPVLTLIAFRVPENFSGTLLVGLVCGAPLLHAAARMLVAVRERDRVGRRILGFLVMAAVPIGLAVFELRQESIVTYLGSAIDEPVVEPDWHKTVALLPSAKLAYLECMIRNVVRPPLILFYVAGLLALPFSAARFRLPVAGMTLLPMLALSFIERKGSWYLVPAMPGLALATAMGLVGIRARGARIALCAGAVAAAIWLRVGVVYAPNAVVDALRSRFGHEPWAKSALELLHPRTILSGDSILPKRAQSLGASGLNLGDYVHGLSAEATPVRLLVLSTEQHVGLGACWMVEIQAPLATCFAGVGGFPGSVDPTLLDPDRYDVLTWVERTGLAEISLAPDVALPRALERALTDLPDEHEGAARALIAGVRERTWEIVPLPMGPAYRRVR